MWYRCEYKRGCESHDRSLQGYAPYGKQKQRFQEKEWKELVTRRRDKASGVSPSRLGVVVAAAQKEARFTALQLAVTWVSLRTVHADSCLAFRAKQPVCSSPVLVPANLARGPPDPARLPIFFVGVW